MKLFFSLFITTAFVVFSAFTPSNTESLAIGAQAPKADLKMKGIDGKEYSLKQAAGQNGLLVIFTSNTCPFVVGAEGYGDGWDGRYAALGMNCRKNNVGMVLVNSNEAKRSNGESLEDMKARAAEMNYGAIPYVLDANSELANAFGAKTTPHVFLFDKNLKLVYKGSIDDSNESPSKVTKRWLDDAISKLASSMPCDPAETKPVGCSIKRVQ